MHVSFSSRTFSLIYKCLSKIWDILQDFHFFLQNLNPWTAVFYLDNVIAKNIVYIYIDL